MPTELIVSGPYRCGKTVAILMFIHELLCWNPGMYAMVVRPTYTSIQGSIILQLKDKILRDGFSGPNNPIKTAFGGQTPSRLIYKNGSIMFFGGMDRNPDKILGGEYDLVFYNQVEQGEKEHWEILASRMLEARHGFWNYPYPNSSLLIGDCNPSRERHWILQRLLMPDTNLSMVYVGLEDNPDLHDGDDWTNKGKKYLQKAKTTLSGMELQRGLYGVCVFARGASL